MKILIYGLNYIPELMVLGNTQVNSPSGWQKEDTTSELSQHRLIIQNGKSVKAIQLFAIEKRF